MLRLSASARDNTESVLETIEDAELSDHRLAVSELAIEIVSIKDVSAAIVPNDSLPMNSVTNPSASVAKVEVSTTEKVVRAISSVTAVATAPSAPKSARRPSVVIAAIVLATTPMTKKNNLPYNYRYSSETAATHPFFV